MKPNSSNFIEKLQLEKHPEGGYFKEIYRAEEMIKSSHLPSRFNGDRYFSTSIYYLLENDDCSLFHRIKSDEIWHFYSGSSLMIYVINRGVLEEVRLGKNFEQGEVFQTVIPRECWFAAKVIEKKSFSLVGCTVAPGFDFTDFEIAKRSVLLKEYPDLKDVILEMTKK